MNGTKPLTKPFENHLIPASIEIGTGTWQWGDTMVWGYGGSYGENEIHAAFQASLDAGINFFDTAELYGWGKSERFIGQFVAEQHPNIYIATKFLPFPWRFTKAQLIAALSGSLKRLQMSSVDLYQIHWPMPPVRVETWASALADALDLKMTRAVGVSNYNRARTIRSYDALQKRGYPLASNQVEYSLLDRHIERDGTLQACQERGVKVIAYSPLAKGLLTGKYTVENPPPGRRASGAKDALAKIPPLLERMKALGEAHGGKTLAQVAVNWTICKGALPIPGAKNAGQVQQNAGSIGWRLTADEVAELDQISDRLHRGG
ncbi:MAG TPA: aldo/keto reductase [Phototrophicaceae bacterium]|nr:aldo/keto reductase [Phototrophicaceae bacterium]